MTLNTSKITGDTITAAEWNESATAANKVTDSTLVAANISDFDTEVSNNTTVTGKLDKAGDTMTGALNMGTNDMTNIQLAEFAAEYDNGNSGTAKTIVFGNGNSQKITLTDNVTLTFTAPSGPAHLQVKLIQDATGSRTVTWPTINWVGATAPTLTTTASAVDIVNIWYDGSAYYGIGSINFG